MRSIGAFLLLSLFIVHTHAQTYQVSRGIPVIDERGTEFLSPWAGAMNTPQFSGIDLNQDGFEDLVLYDRDDETFTPYLNAQRPNQFRYSFAPEFLASFDSCDCHGWALLVDYNCDGLEDVFCGTVTSNVQVYEQYREGGYPRFELAYDKVDTRIFNPTSLFSNKTDIPAIIDVDYDGDLDFMTFGQISNYIEYHQNQAMERFGRCDTLVFEVETTCWGHFFESNSDNSATLNDTLNCLLGDFSPPPVRSGARHTGSTTLLLDLNADSTYDALIGDVAFDEVYALYNGGNTRYAYFDSLERDFPISSVSIDVPTFPACFYVDVTNDGKRDLIVAPHATEGYENTRGTWWYQNEGEDNQPEFDFSGDGFLQDQTIDLGTGTAPAFLDFNGDGKKDLLVGNRGYYDPNEPDLVPGLALFENIGTVASPRFQLRERNYLNLPEFPNLRNVRPAVGDLDGDGDEDLLMGNLTGTLYYFENVAPPGEGAAFRMIDEAFGGIDVGWYSSPFLYDWDGDEDPDLFVGNRSGNIAYFENTGTRFLPNFELITEEWGFVKIDDEFGGNFSFGFAQPILLDYDQDGEMELWVGGVQGGIEVFEGLENALTDTLTRVEVLAGFRVGRNASPTAAVIDSTGREVVIVGNSRGGLMMLQPQATTTSQSPVIPDEPTIRAFPNPVADVLHIELPHFTGKLDVEVFNLLGQTQLQTHLKGPEYQLTVSDLSTGIYIVRAQGNGKYHSFRMIKQ